MWPLLVALQLQIPAPVGYVNDFAGIIRPEVVARMTQLIDTVRARSGGEIAVVTLTDLGGRPSMDVAVRIGREWGVGAQGAAGDPARNAGVVVLLKPGARPGDGRSELAIATGRGAEGFVTDALAGRIRDEIGRVAVASGRYDDGLLAGVELLAQAYARGLPEDGSRPAPARRRAPVLFVLVLVAVGATALFALVLLGSEWQSVQTAERRDGAWWGAGGTARGDGSGGSLGGSWWGGGFGGGGGGGFGGFGGGGGFSGGGASGSF